MGESLTFYKDSNLYSTKKITSPKADMVILNSTAFGNSAIRDPRYGSPFITELCKQFKIKNRRTIYQECLKWFKTSTAPPYSPSYEIADIISDLKLPE